MHLRTLWSASFLLVVALVSLVAPPANAGPKAATKAASGKAAATAAGAKPASAEPAKPAQPATPAKPSADELRRRAKVRAQANGLIAKLLRSSPGPVRYKLVDAVIDLGDPAWDVVNAALPKLWKLKDAEAVVVDLLHGFMNASYEVLIANEPRLSDGAARRVLKFVTRQIEDHDDRFYRLLGSMMKRDDAELLAEVLGELLHKRWPGVMDRCIRLIDHKDPSVQAYVVDALANERYLPAQPFMVRRLGVDQRAAKPENLAFRIKLINAIAAIGGDGSVAPLIVALGYADQRRHVLNGLRLVGMPAVSAAVFMLTTAEGGRIETAFAILEHLRIIAAPELVRLLESGSEATRRIAVDVLAHLNVPSVRDELVRMVKEDRFVDIRDGIRLAVSMYNPVVRDMLFDLLQRETKRPAVRKFVVEQFWRLRDPRTFRMLRTLAATDKDQDVRLTAMQAVAGVGDPRGPQLLRKLLGVPYVQQRLAILDVLARVDTWQSAVPAIAKLLGDPNHKVFLAALGALRRMTFHSGPQRTAGWLAWHQAEMARAPTGAEQTRAVTRRFVVDDREMGYLEVGSDRPTIVVVAGPPFRDATHLAPHVWPLADDHRVVVMQRAPGPYSAAHASETQQDAELLALLGRLGERPVILMTDATGAHFALGFARRYPRDVRKVILHGAFWPSTEGLEQCIGQVHGAIRNEMRDDLAWGFSSQWRVPPAVRHRTIFRAALSGLLANWEHGRRVSTANLADDAFIPATLDRIRAEYRRQDVAKVRVPVLLLLGEQAPWSATTLADVAKLKGKSKRLVRVVKIPHSGWMPLLENPAAAVDAIDDFLD